MLLVDTDASTIDMLTSRSGSAHGHLDERARSPGGGATSRFHLHAPRSLVLAGACALLVACGGTTPPAKAPEKCAPQNITVSILSSRTINLSAQGEARPVVVRLYQLKAEPRLYNASFEQVWKDDKSVLADDLVSAEDVQVYPGVRTDVKFVRPPTVNHVAAVALFSSPTGRAWFSILDLPPVPEDGKCGLEACPAGDEECANATFQNPHIVYWVDGSKVDDGVEHLDDFPEPGAMRAKD